MFILFPDSSNVQVLQLQLDRIEAKLDLLLKHAELELPASPMELAVRKLLQANQPIEALKLVRSKTGMNLKSAKQWIAALQPTGLNTSEKN
jgi:ribosomal protein L7/L12